MLDKQTIREAIACLKGKNLYRWQRDELVAKLERLVETDHYKEAYFKGYDKGVEDERDSWSCK